jgi:hypothetical protein
VLWHCGLYRGLNKPASPPRGLNISSLDRRGPYPSQLELLAACHVRGLHIPWLTPPWRDPARRGEPTRINRNLFTSSCHVRYVCSHNPRSEPYGSRDTPSLNLAPHRSTTFSHNSTPFIPPPDHARGQSPYCNHIHPLSPLLPPKLAGHTPLLP